MFIDTLVKRLQSHISNPSFSSSEVESAVSGEIKEYMDSAIYRFMGTSPKNEHQRVMHEFETDLLKLFVGFVIGKTEKLEIKTEEL